MLRLSSAIALTALMSAPALAQTPQDGDAAVTQVLAPILAQSGMPAMAAAIVDGSGARLIGTVGVRKRGEKAAVTVDDAWHLGSDTKAMTAALIARLVERGKLRWDETLGEIFPEISETMDPQFRSATLLQVLSHRAGLPPDLDLTRYGGEGVVDLRSSAAAEALSHKPMSRPGSTYAYSNLGYIIAGAAIERTLGESWETALTREVFAPLGMSSCGFGGTGTLGELDAPWPHMADGTPAPSNGPDEDNPPVMGPAGRVHCSLRDWAKFIADQLKGAQGRPGLLKASSYKVMQTPPFGGDYALGWLVEQRAWAGGTALTHAGSNTMNFADAWLAPGPGFAILVCVNQGGDKAFAAADSAVAALLPAAKPKR